MRKLIASVNITLDGFMAGPNSELDWHFNLWTPEMAEVQSKQLSLADTVLLGRVTYDAMAAYWPAVNTDLSFPREDLAFADLINSRQKVVFSKTVNQLSWGNSKKISGILSREIYMLKRSEGKNIIVYGSAKLLSSLIKLGVVDEFILWMHPVLLGNGKLLFSGINNNRDLRLLTVKNFSSGVVLLHYSI